MLSAAIASKALWPNERELSRKIVHIGTGPVILFAWWLNIPRTLAIPIASAITIILMINHRFRIIPSVEDVDRDSYGTVAYGLTITLLLTFFWPNNAPAVCSGILVMAFGDGLAGLIGRKVISPSWLIWGQRKSLAGTLTMTLTTIIVLIAICLIANTPIHPIRVIAIALFAALLEQLGKWGIDNLTVPIGVTCTWLWMTTA